MYSIGLCPDKISGGFTHTLVQIMILLVYGRPILLDASLYLLEPQFSIISTRGAFIACTESIRHGKTCHPRHLDLPQFKLAPPFFLRKQVTNIGSGITSTMCTASRMRLSQATRSKGHRRPDVLFLFQRVRRGIFPPPKSLHNINSAPVHTKILLKPIRSKPKIRVSGAC